MAENMGTTCTAAISTGQNGQIIDHKKLSKRLAYLLRYGAEKEGLHVQEGGYVELMSLLRVPLLRWYQPYHVLQEIEHSMSHRGTKRFERKFINGNIYVRAQYGRRMERNPNHEGSKVPRLLETCLNTVCDHLMQYDLELFPDEFLLNTLIHKLKRQKRLNNKGLRVILGPTIEHLDLGAVYLTESTIKLVANRCPHLKVLNLRDCGYVLNDHFMEILLKKLPELESLNLSGCRHLTDRTQRAICKNCPNIQALNMTDVLGLTEQGVVDLVQKCEKLTHLDIFHNKNITAEGKERLTKLAQDHKVTIVLEGQELGLASDASLTLPLAGVSNYW